MKLPDEYEQQNLSPGVKRMLIGAMLFVAGLFVLILLVNRQQQTSGNQPSGNKEATMGIASGQTNPQIEQNTLTPDDFDFWDMYPEETTEETVEESTETQTQTENDPSTDGRHTLVTDKDGKEEWVLISPYLPKQEYDYTKLICRSGFMEYYEDGKKVSYVGATVSKYQDYVDFVKLRKAGVDFVMIRVGVRGYGTGQLIMDENFSDNMKRATDAGLKIGLYFSSQAVTEEEVLEEAEMVLESIGDYTVSYPIVFDMELVDNDTARIENLTREERTNLAKTFLNTISEAGYQPMLYGNKEWLMKKIDLSKLTSYDVWLDQPGDLPDYPYRFTMWQYSDTVSVDGIAGYADLSISFIDYSEK
ncbi:MAG: GH25 family lysozyme [Lachnospiraceae bacterium]